MMLKLVTTGQFRKDYKRVKKRGYNMGLLEGELILTASRTGTHADLF